MSVLRHACGVPGPGERLLDGSPLDAAERQTLALVRVVCGVMDRDGVVPAEMIVEAAEALVPGACASAMACTVVRLVRAAALGRAERFAFSNPSCPTCARVLTVPERHLLDVLRHARAGRRGPALVSATLLCDRGEPGRVAGAAFDLAAVMALLEPPGRGPVCPSLDRAACPSAAPPDHPRGPSAEVPPPHPNPSTWSPT